MAINWAPDAEQEVRQNVDTIVKTEAGSVPGYREFGTPQAVVDQPQAVTAALLQSDVIKAIRTFEPRVNAKTIRMEGTNAGELSVTFRMVKP